MKKGQLAIWFSVFFVIIILLLITAFAAPILTRMSTAFYTAGQDIIMEANESITSIQDETVRHQIGATLTNAQLATQTNIEITSGIFQYSWVFITALIVIVGFLFTRRIVEFQNRGII